MSSLFNIKGKVIAVTGATGALAGGTAKYLLSEGATVIFLSRNLEKVNATVESARTISEQAYGYACDVLDEARIREVKDDIIAQFGRIDALVNGAGGNMPGATISPDKTVFDLAISDYDSVMDLNLKGTLLPSLVFGEEMVKQKAGSIVNFSSMSSEQVITRVLGYSNAKAAVDNLTRWMATDFAQKFGDKIRVNAVAPGFFIGDQNRKLLTNEDGSYTERGQQVISNTPMGRFGEANEIYGAIHYLLCEASRFVTGTTLNVDGGFSVYSGV
ncbi:SDR family oxidoreductase [Puniceicoccaceae bacterium K14]|nr:SDR family oxidoreductase [Puniceicoccaceae bacterium K14]